MKRWEMVAKALKLTKEEAIDECEASGVDTDDEIDLLPARDLGRDISMAILVGACEADYTWLAELVEKWERLTGRAKEGQ